MSTVDNIAPGDLAPCWHCHGPMQIECLTAPYEGPRSGPAAWCNKCGVLGPIMPTELEAVQAWNAVRVFGRVGVVHGKAGIPNYTTAAAEHLRLTSENVAAGVYGDPVAFFVGLVFPAGRAVHVVNHRLDRSSIVAAARAIADSGKVELSLAPPSR